VTEHLPSATGKRGGYPGSGDGPSMPPPPPDPSGSPPAERYPATEWLKAALREGHPLNPVRAHALTQAVEHVGVNGTESPDVPGEVLAIAERFEAWLTRDEAERP